MVQPVALASATADVFRRAGSTEATGAANVAELPAARRQPAASCARRSQANRCRKLCPGRSHEAPVRSRRIFSRFSLQRQPRFFCFPFLFCLPRRLPPFQQALPCRAVDRWRGQGRAHRSQFVMRWRATSSSSFSPRGKIETSTSYVAGPRAARAPHVSMPFKAVDQFNDAVMFQRQPFRQRANRRLLPAAALESSRANNIAEAQPGSPRRRVSLAQKLPNPVPQFRQRPILFRLDPAIHL